MSESNPKAPNLVPPPPPSSSSSSSSGSGSGNGSGVGNSSKYSAGSGGHINPRETVNPDAATLRDQWRYAIKQYSRWYSQAWGTAILAGITFFALGWVIKGENPLPSFHSSSDSDADKDKPTS